MRFTGIPAIICVLALAGQVNASAQVRLGRPNPLSTTGLKAIVGIDWNACSSRPSVNVSGLVVSSTLNKGFAYQFDLYTNVYEISGTAVGSQQAASGPVNHATTGTFGRENLPPATFSMPSSATGLAAVQLVLNPGQSPIYSNMVAFPVACAPLPPTGFRFVNGMQDCVANGGSFACTVAFAANPPVPVAVWNAPPNGYQKVDGYRIYRTDVTPRRLFLQSPGSGSKIAFLEANQEPVSSGCYVVVAYSGSVESGPSNALCPQSQTNAPKSYTADLPLYEWCENEQEGDYTTGGYVPSLSFETSGLQPGEAFGCVTNPPPGGTWDSGSDLAVGYVKLDTGGLIGSWLLGYVNRGGLLFDLSPLYGSWVQSATLRLGFGGSYVTPGEENAGSYQDSKYRQNVPCELYLGLASQPMYAGSDNNAPSDVDAATYDGEGRNTNIDVTSTIRSLIANGGSNYGFVLRGDYDGDPRNATHSCENYFYGATLHVVYNK